MRNRDRFYLPDIERCACLRRRLADEFGCNLGPGWPLLADCNHDSAVFGKRRENREEVEERDWFTVLLKKKNSKLMTCSMAIGAAKLRRESARVWRRRDHVQVLWHRILSSSNCTLFPFREEKKGFNRRERAK